MSAPTIATIADGAATAFVVGPTDVLVVQVADDQDAELLEPLAAALRERVGERFLILHGSVRIGVVQGGAGDGVPVDA